MKDVGLGTMYFKLILTKFWYLFDGNQSYFSKWNGRFKCVRIIGKIGAKRVAWCLAEGRAPRRPRYGAVMPTVTTHWFSNCHNIFVTYHIYANNIPLESLFENLQLCNMLYKSSKNLYKI